MIKKLLVTYFILLAAGIFAQKKLTTFQHTFQAAGMNGGLFVENTPDSGFVVTGQHQTTGAGSCDIYVYKRDKCGVIEFYKTYGGVEAEGGTSVRPTNDGGLIVGAFSASYPALAGCGVGCYHSQLLKLNAAGNVQWHKVYNTNNDDRFLCVQQTADNGYIAAGTAIYTTNCGYIVKTDVNGTMQWGNRYTVSASVWSKVRIKYVEQTSDGGFIAIGKQDVYTSPDNYSLFLMKLDPAGSVQWCKKCSTIGSVGENNEEDDYSVCGQITPDGGYIATVGITSSGAGGYDIMVAKFDAAGTTQWAKSYGGAGKDQPRSIRTTKDGGYIVSGYTMSFGGGEQDAYLLKLDISGNLEWSRAYGGPLREKAEGVREFYDGGFVADGHTASFGANVFDVYSLKTDSVGHSGCNEVDPPTQVFLVGLTETLVPMTFAAVATETTQPIIENDFVPTPVVLCEEDLSIKVSFAPDKVCIGKPITFIDNSSVTNGVLNMWDWDFGDGSPHDSVPSPAHLYTTADTFLVKLTVNGSEACFPSSGIDTVIVYPDPLAAYTAIPVCLNNVTTFTDSSIGNGGIINSYSWNFGETTSAANTSSIQSPQHQYSNPGTYTVSLVTVTTAGCIDSVKKTVQVNPLPLPAFSGIDVCLGDITSFNDQSTIAAGDTIKTWSWNFGESSSATNTSANTSPMHTYLSDGMFTVWLTTISAKGCKDSVQKQVEVNPLPTALFNPKDICVSSPLSFKDSSLANGGIINNWHWDFGEAPITTDTSNVSAPTYTYNTPGNYTVTLSVITSKGCKDTIQHPLIIYPNAIPDFINTEVCLNQITSFTDSSTVSVGNISYYHWDFGVPIITNDTANIPSTTYTYNAAGTYTAELTIYANGCKAIHTQQVIVNSLPLAAFTTGPVCEGAATGFTDGSSVANPSNISTWNWNFGEPASATNTSGASNPTHTYAAAGDYTITLNIVTDKGCKDSIPHPVTVYPLPVPDFGPFEGCAPLCITMHDSSVVPAPDQIKGWLWTFSDNTTSDQQNPYKCFPTSGIFDVKLEVTTNHNCKAVKTLDSVINVFPKPDAQFIVDPHKASQLQPVFNFTDLSQGNPVSWSWSFGDPADTHDTIQNPKFTYPEQAGEYTIQLIITNQYGCMDTATDKIEVIPEWTFYAPNTFTPNGDGINDVFFGTGIGHVEKEMWIYDRWGNEIYHIVGLNGVWDGKVQNGASNAVAQIDTYVWIIRIKEIFGNYHQYLGHVNIVK